MSLANIVGAILQQGLAGQSQTSERVQGLGAQAGASSGLEQLLGAMLGGGQAGGGQLGGGRAPAQGGDLGAMLGGLLGGQAGGPGANPLGGLIGAMLGGAQGGGGRGADNPLAGMLGAMLGGGGRTGTTAAGGGAMAALGALAMSALQAYAKSASAPAAAPDPAHAPELMAESAERLVLRAMIAAAKADGAIDRAEMDRIFGKIGDGGVSPAEKAFVEAEIAAPLDPAAIAAEARTPELAAQAYAASILAIDIDSEPERAYLRALAAALRLPDGAVQQLHRMTGAPAV